MILRKEDLIGIFNDFWLKDKKTFKISYAKKELFIVTLGESIKIRHIINKNDLDNFSKIDEIPDYDDLLLCFRCSNILKWANEEQILKILKEFIIRTKDSQERKICLSYDTCSLRHRDNRIIRDMTYKIKEKNKHMNYPNIIIPEGINKELRKWDNKYKKPLIDELKTYVPQAGSFLNQINLSSRRVKIGSLELKNMLKSPFSFRIESEIGDENIIDSLKRYRKEKDCDILAFSEDDNFVEMAKEEGIISQLIIHKRKLEHSFECSWQELADLIYICSIVFGAIKMDNKTIFGIWTGKKGDNWNNKEIEIL